MMLTAMGQAIGYGDIEQAKRLQSLAMNWVKNPERRDAIYATEFHSAAGWSGTSSGLD
jgi:hypothetical protein